MDLYRAHQITSRNLKRARELLEFLEWGHPVIPQTNGKVIKKACPICFHLPEDGHDDHCYLGRFLHPELY